MHSFCITFYLKSAYDKNASPPPSQADMPLQLVSAQLFPSGKLCKPRGRLFKLSSESKRELFGILFIFYL